MMRKGAPEEEAGRRRKKTTLPISKSMRKQKRGRRKYDEDKGLPPSETKDTRGRGR